jgi:hypothetical protein
MYSVSRSIDYPHAVLNGVGQWKVGQLQLTKVSKDIQIELIIHTSRTWKPESTQTHVHFRQHHAVQSVLFAISLLIF